MGLCYIKAANVRPWMGLLLWSFRYPERVDSLKQILLKICNGNLQNGIYDFDKQPLTELNDIKSTEEQGMKITN